MSIVVSKWGNSLGIRIPAAIVEALSIHSGDTVDYELNGDTFSFTKKKSTKQLFEEFYGKNFDSLTPQDLGEAPLIDYGEDVGGEKF